MTTTTAPRLSTHELRSAIRGYAARYQFAQENGESVDEYAEMVAMTIQAHGPRIPGLKSWVIREINLVKREVQHA